MECRLGCLRWCKKQQTPLILSLLEVFSCSELLCRLGYRPARENDSKEYRFFCTFVEDNSGKLVLRLHLYALFEPQCQEVATRQLQSRVFMAPRGQAWGLNGVPKSNLTSVWPFSEARMKDITNCLSSWQTSSAREVKGSMVPGTSKVLNERMSVQSKGVFIASRRQRD